MGACVMFPNNVLSTKPVIGRFLSYYGDKVPAIDYCKAGLDINDASKGLNYQLWRCRLYGNADIKISKQSDNYASETLITNIPNSTQVSLAFDSNMTPAVCTIASSNLKLYWYDSTIPGYTTLTIAARDAMIRIDDVRDFASNYRDIILAYIRPDNMLCYRLQRDRFTIEYALQQWHPWQKIYQCGMTDQNRFQFAPVWDASLINGC